MFIAFKSSVKGSINSSTLFAFGSILAKDRTMNLLFVEATDFLCTYNRPATRTRRTDYLTWLGSLSLLWPVELPQTALRFCSL
jgi:hypothetical protein